MAHPKRMTRHAKSPIPIVSPSALCLILFCATFCTTPASGAPAFWGSRFCLQCTEVLATVKEDMTKGYE